MEAKNEYFAYFCMHDDGASIQDLGSNAWHSGEEKEKGIYLLGQ